MRRRYSVPRGLSAQRDARRVERAQLALQRQAAIAARLHARQATQDYVASRESETEEQIEDLHSRMEALRHVLSEALSSTPSIDFERLKETPELPGFNPLGFDRPEEAPELATFLPSPLPFLQRLFPPLVERHQTKIEVAESAYADAVKAHDERARQRALKLAALREDHTKVCDRIRTEVAARNHDIDVLAKAFKDHEQPAVIEYFSMVLDDDELPEGLPAELRVTYGPESRQLVIERQLPTLDAIPQNSGYRYIKKSDSIEPVSRKAAEIRSLYIDLLAQITLRTLWTAVKADTEDAVAVIVFNGFVDTIDPSTGNRVKPMLISVSTTKETLLSIAFEHVEPMACLRNLKALVSRNAHELEPVRPLVSFDMVDKRFIDKTDVLSDLDSRPNLANLSPSEFEVLMTNLFEKMGLETRLTQASRDGGVDCVAWDMRPVIGGKVVIQAKRYKNTVGVSAVRDLYGTMMNEGAAKGILVTTSGYGPTAYNFAKNKPIELITGSNLLAMLEQYASVQAKIEFPLEWTDAEQTYQEGTS